MRQNNFSGAPPNLYGEGIFFSQKAVTGDELAIAEILKTLYRSRKQKDVGAIISLFSSDAQINVWPTKKYVGIGAYEEYLKKHIQQLMSTIFSDISILVQDGRNATASMMVYYWYTGERGSSVGPARMVFIFEKKDKKWRINRVLPE